MSTRDFGEAERIVKNSIALEEGLARVRYLMRLETADEAIKLLDALVLSHTISSTDRSNFLLKLRKGTKKRSHVRATINQAIGKKFDA